MQNRLARVGTAAAVALIAIAFLGALTIWWDGASPSTTSPVSVVQAREVTAPAALRAISIPFGIGSSFVLTGAGDGLSITGHAVCWEESQMFDLHVRVAQSTTAAFAEGQSIDICADGERQMWDAQMLVDHAPAFAAGPARACAEAVEYGQHGIVQTHHWCKDIDLTSE